VGGGSGDGDGRRTVGILLTVDVDRERDRQQAMGFDTDHDMAHTDSEWDGLMDHYYRRVEEAQYRAIDPILIRYNVVCLMALAAARAESRQMRNIVEG
jgi:hypothetical protein